MLVLQTASEASVEYRHAMSMLHGGVVMVDVAEGRKDGEALLPYAKRSLREKRIDSA